MLTLRQIEVFRAVLRAGTLVGAARQLGIAQPTVTRILKRVEDVVGLPLFERSKGRLTPTAEARRMLGEIERAFEALHHAIGRAAHAATEGSRFCVGASPSLGRLLVPEALAALSRAHPGLSLQLDVLSVSQVAAYLTEGPGEAVVTLFPLQQAGIHSVRVGSGALVALVPRDWPLAGQAALRPEDLQGQPLAVFGEHAVHGQAVNAFLAQGGATPGQRHLVRFAESAAALAEAGIAIALIDAFSAMAVRRDRVAVLPTTAERGFEVYLHRVMDRLQARFTLPFQQLLTEGIARLAAKPMP
ncbi:LysR family transcriptional regulator [Acetobacteraceae bacterium H6797]|nr:LysR family transcriptional regulator [Acetobacteraceae bacterium H6797]